MNIFERKMNKRLSIIINYHLALNIISKSYDFGKEIQVFLIFLVCEPGPVIDKVDEVGLSR